MILLSELDSALPAQLKGKLTPEMQQSIAAIITDEQQARQFRDNFVNYTRVLQEGKFKLEDYVNAVLYVGFKLMGYSDRECYQRTFPDRYTELVSRGTPSKDIAAYVAAYNRNMLVNRIFEQTIIPTYVLNQDAIQRAINTQVDIMGDPKASNRDRVKAADSLLTHLKKPETAKVELSVDFKKSEETESLEDAMRTLIENQKTLIGLGHTTESIAHARMINVTPDETNS
jgi:hypothetical protein